MMNRIALTLAALVFTVSCAHKETTPAPAASPTTATNPLAAANGMPGAATPTAVGGPLAPRPAKVVEPRKPDDSLHPRGIDFGATIKTVAFGSSANQDLPQPIWNVIAENNPDLFLFMGDNVHLTKQEQKSVTAQYRKLDSIPEYRAFREKVPFLATWDNEDYSDQKEFLKYWTYVGNSIAFGQKGIYHAKIIGPKKKQVQIIVLDTRSFRTKADDAKATMLGEMQWSWLEDQLKHPAQVRMVVSSIPLIATEHGTDKWGLYPKERQRFFDLLKKTGVHNIIVFSGDRHQSSIAKTSVKDWGMLFDITASPINEPASAAEEDASFEGKAYAGESFGFAQIDWHDKKMSLQIRDAANKVLNSVSFKIK
jgi:alkaline phosphatase D